MEQHFKRNWIRIFLKFLSCSGLIVGLDGKIFKDKVNRNCVEPEICVYCEIVIVIVMHFTWKCVYGTTHTICSMKI